MLVNCSSYQDGKKLVDFPFDSLATHEFVTGEFVWVALADATPEELNYLAAVFQLHELSVEDAGRCGQRPKIDEYGDQLFAILPLYERKEDDINIGELSIFAGPNFIISIRRNHVKPFSTVRIRCEAEPEFLQLGPGFVLYALIDAVVDRYLPVIESFEYETEALEESIFHAGEARQTLYKLYRIKQKMTVIKHGLLPLLDGIEKLYGGRTPPLSRNLSEYYRDVADHLSKLLATSEQIRETVATAIYLTLSMTTIEDSVVTKKLAAWAGIAAVPTAMAGIWGMNFNFMPELTQVWGYPAALLTMLSICGALYYRFKRVGWL